MIFMAMIVAFSTSAFSARILSDHFLRQEITRQYHGRDPWENPAADETILISGVYRFSEFLDQSVNEQRLASFQIRLEPRIIFIAAGSFLAVNFLSSAIVLTCLVKIKPLSILR